MSITSATVEGSKVHFSNCNISTKNVISYRLGLYNGGAQCWLYSTIVARERAVEVALICKYLYCLVLQLR